MPTQADTASTVEGKGHIVADYAWVQLRIWPWQYAWLEQDDEFRGAFDEAGLLTFRNTYAAVPEIAPAMNGDVQDWNQNGFTTLVITGEMRGGSYELREDLALLDVLRERNIAWYLKGDAAYDWDGDEAFWHPGMSKPFHSAANESGRVLDNDEFERLRVLSLPIQEQIALIDGYIEQSKNDIEQRVAIDDARVKAGEDPINKDMMGVYQSALRRNHRKRKQLERTSPSDLGELVAAHFALDPFAWKPTTRHRVKLKEQDGAA